MTFVFQRPAFLQDVYGHQQKFLVHVLYGVDKVEFYVSVNLLYIANILNSSCELTKNENK